MFQKANLACWQRPKLYLCWHKSVWSLLTSAISFFFLFFLCTVLLVGSWSPAAGIGGEWDVPLGFNSERLSCAAVETGLNSGTKPGWVACILNLFANRSRAQSVHVTLIRTHSSDSSRAQHLRLLSTRPPTFSLSFLMWLPHTDIKYTICTTCNNMYFISFSIHIWSPFLYIHKSTFLRPSQLLLLFTKSSSVSNI